MHSNYVLSARSRGTRLAESRAFLRVFPFGRFLLGYPGLGFEISPSRIDSLRVAIFDYIVCISNFLIIGCNRRSKRIRKRCCCSKQCLHLCMKIEEITLKFIKGMVEINRRTKTDKTVLQKIREECSIPFDRIYFLSHGNLWHFTAMHSKQRGVLLTPPLCIVS